MDRRLVGVDLGIASAHTVVVTDAEGTVVARRKCRPTVESLEIVEAAALVGAPPGTRLEVVVEPTGVAWLPVAVFFCRRGHLVYRVSSAKASALRKFLSAHAKTNSIDAETLARLPIVDPRGVTPLELPTGELAALDRRVRACDRLTQAQTERKIRLRELARQLYPTIDSVIGGEVSRCDVAMLERWADPHRLLRAPRQRLVDVVHKTSSGQKGADHVDAWRAAATESMALYGDDPAVAFDDLAAEIATECRLLRAIWAEHKGHAAAREAAYKAADPGGLARSLPGVATIGGPLLVAAIANPARFPNVAAFKSYTGLAPRASETGDTDRKGQPMSKAGPSRLRHQLVLSANTARRLDPQLAAIYYTQMVERGAHHTKALCVVAARLAERGWLVMARGEPYVICDIDGRAVDAVEAKAIIAERYTVPEEIRRRRRSRKTKARGKAPQHTGGRDTRGDLPPTSSSGNNGPRVKTPAGVSSGPNRPHP